jgi:uncharacterized membrane protein
MAPTFVEVPGGQSCDGVTPDGTTVVGSGIDSTGAEYVAYTWRWQVDAVPTFIGNPDGDPATPNWRGVAISDDGSVVLGYRSLPPLPGIFGTVYDTGLWTEAGGWQSIGHMPGVAGNCEFTIGKDLSGDGTVVVGWANDSDCDKARAFRWTQAGGFVELANLGTSSNQAAVIAADGTRMAGYSNTNGRTGALWEPNGTGFELGDAWGEVAGISDDGSMFVGERKGDTAVGPYQGRAFYRTFGGAPVEIGHLADGYNAQAVDLAEGAGVIIGFDHAFPEKEAVAWIWTPATGILQLQGFLTTLGIPGVPVLQAPTAITPDGAVISGHNSLGSSAWVARIFPSTIASVQVYGCGLNPEDSMRVLSGVPAIGQTVVLGVDNTAPAPLPGAGVAMQAISGFAFPGTFPCGYPLADWGLDPAESYVGELLIWDAPLNVTVPWTQGVPAAVPYPVPNDVSFLGANLHVQGVIIDVVNDLIGLTDAAWMLIGL